MGTSKGKRGAHIPGGLSAAGGSPVRLPLPLALGCCVALFYAGSLFGSKSFSGLPDTAHPRKGGHAAAGASSGAAGGASSGAAAGAAQQVPGVAQREGAQQGRAGAAEGDAAHLVSAAAGATSQSRRQLAAHEGDSQVALVEGEGGGGGEGQAVAGAVVTLPMGRPYPHGSTGESTVDTVAMQMISWKPRAYIFPDFAPPEKCDAIVALAKKFMHPSGLALRPGETAEATREIRTSSGAFLASSQDGSGALGWVERKMARISMIPPQHGEAFNVLRYEQGQHYDSHMDVFDPKEYGPQGSNRVASFLLYLTDVEEGGETMFPYEGGRNMNIGYNYKDCIGLKVKPKKGDALLFWSMFPDGKIDPHSLHGSCPVRKGEKWVATKWIRDKPMHW